MTNRIARAVVEGAVLVLVYALAENWWRHRPLFGDLVGLALVFASYLALSIAAILLARLWRR